MINPKQRWKNKSSDVITCIGVGGDGVWKLVPGREPRGRGRTGGDGRSFNCKGCPANVLLLLLIHTIHSFKNHLMYAYCMPMKLKD